MNNIEELRNKINEIDLKELELFVERFNIVKEIALIKQANNQPIFNLAREKELKESLLSKIDDLYLKSLYESYIDKKLELSKKYQHMLIDDFVININGEYDCIIANNSIDKIDKYFNLSRKVLIVTDDGIPSNYIEKITSNIKNYYVVIINHGDEFKNEESLDIILKALFDNSFNRYDCIIGVGGGMICDLASFASSIYERGIDHYLVPTTLLAMVDASIGGKTAINFCGVKNVIGTFFNPTGVLIDPLTLKSLPKELIEEGIAECIKMGLTLDKSLFDLIKKSNLDTIDYELLIKKCILNKKLVIELDFKEKNYRKVLNFGHTIGHAVEVLSNHSLLHGQSVAIGMKYFCSKEVREELEFVLNKYNLNRSIDLPTCKMIEVISHDKKNNDLGVELVYVDKIGSFEFHIIDYYNLEQIIKGEKDNGK